MIMKVRPAAFCFLIGAAACLLAAEQGSAQECRVTLKSGNVITAPHCYEENGVVYLLKLGGTVGMHRRDVAKIEKVEAEETEETAEVSVAAPTVLPAGKEERMRRLMTETSAEREARKKAEKQAARAQKAARAEEERPYKEFKSYEESLKSARNNEAIYCGRALEPMAASKSGPISGEAAGAAIKTMHDAVETCKYYKNRIPQLEKKLEELRSACGSKCR